VTRIILEFALPKDGYLLLPFDAPEFENYGTAASTKYPSFVDAPEDEVWSPEDEVCEQELYSDFTGVDSLSAFLLSIMVFVSVQYIEHRLGRPLFKFPGMEPYIKEGQDANPAAAGDKKGAEDPTLRDPTETRHGDPDKNSKKQERGFRQRGRGGGT
jgi:hypothetical protein